MKYTNLQQDHRIKSDDLIRIKCSNELQMKV